MLTNKCKDQFSRSLDQYSEDVIESENLKRDSIKVSFSGVYFGFGGSRMVEIHANRDGHRATEVITYFESELLQELRNLGEWHAMLRWQDRVKAAVDVAVKRLENSDAYLGVGSYQGAA